MSVEVLSAVVCSDQLQNITTISIQNVLEIEPAFTDWFEAIRKTTGRHRSDVMLYIGPHHTYKSYKTVLPLYFRLEN